MLYPKFTILALSLLKKRYQTEKNILKEHIKRTLFGNRNEYVGYIVNIEHLTVRKE